jgi:hypothetical protein
LTQAVSHCQLVKRMMLAEGVGFEPTIRLPVYTLSKRAPSATRPSLRRGPAAGARCGEYRCRGSQRKRLGVVLEGSAKSEKSLRGGSGHGRSGDCRSHPSEESDHHDRETRWQTKLTRHSKGMLAGAPRHGRAAQPPSCDWSEPDTVSRSWPIA